MKIKLEWISGKKEKNSEGKERIKRIRMAVTQKGTGSIYNVLIILDFLFQLPHLIRKKGHPEFVWFPNIKILP